MSQVLKIRHAVIAAIALVLATSQVNVYAKSLPKSSPERQGFSAERLRMLDTLAQRYVDEGRVAGMVNLVMRNGKVVYFKATGSRGAEAPAPVKTDDLFRIYSMTKPITAVAAMQLYEQGKFHLDDPVHKFVPELKDLQVLNDDGQLEALESPLTMHQLLTHTTGLSYGFAAETDPVDTRYYTADIWAAKDLDAFAEKVAQLPLKFQPGSRWHYSIAVDITGLVIQRLSGMPFNEYLAKHIFQPLKMGDTFFAVPAAKADRFLPNHFINPQNGQLVDIRRAPPPFGPREGVALIDFEKVSLFSGGAGLVSTAMDYARFTEAMRNGGTLDGARILGPKTVAYMIQDHLAANIVATGIGESPAAATSGHGFGLGFGVIKDTTAAGVIGSIGEFSWGGAAGTIFWIDPVEELTVVSMIQLMGSPWPLRADLKVAIYQALAESYSR